MLKKSLVLAALLAASPALAQNVQYISPVTRNHIPVWNTNGVIADGGSSADSPITSIGVTNNGGAGFCVSSDRQTALGRNQLCFGASTAGPAVISLQNYGTAAAQNLQFVINGTPVIIPTGASQIATENPPFVAGHASCYISSAGILQDCGVALGAGTQWGVPYYSTASQLSSTAALTNGQLVVGQTGGAPTPQTMSGDVGSITAGGVFTLAKVNGIPFATTYAAHGVLIGQGTSQFVSTTTSNVGQCLLSQGLSSDPIWSSCAAGSGSAGGSNTQVQFNNATSLGGSANLTWVSPALTIGVAGSVTGQLALAPAGSASGTVTVQNPSTTAAYNFNLPTTSGSSGQPLLSGGGGSTAMSFGTLGTAGGGTNCSAASGTCLDNITNFASTGYINRTGGGTYAFSTVIPVSGGGTALANGTSGGILGFTGTGTIASSGLLAQFGIVVGGGAGATPQTVTNGTAGQVLQAQTSANPAWNTMSGDATISSAGVLTVANSAITVAKQANAAAWTLEGNFTGSSAAPQFSTIGALTNKASPAAGDYVLLQDNAAAGALKYATVSSIAVAGSVSSVDTLTGAVTLLTEPQGRLTLQANTPVMVTSQSAKTAILYDCYIGNQVPYYTGSVDAFDTVASCEQTDTLVAAASAGQVVSANVYDVWWVHGGTNKICLAMSTASGGGGGWSADTGGSNTARGTGYSQLDRTTRGYITNKNSISNCMNQATNYGPVSANQGTYLGTVYASANGQVSYTFGTSASGGTAGLLGVWNMYNRVLVATTVVDSGTSYTYTTATIRQARASAGMQVQLVTGLSEEAANASYNTTVTAANATGALMRIGIGVDSTSTFLAAALYQSPTTTGQSGSPTAAGTFIPGAGLHTLSANEQGDGSNANSFDGTGGAFSNLNFSTRM